MDNAKYTLEEPLFSEYLRANNTFAYESLLNMRACQNPNERMGYLDIVNEAAMTTSGRAALIQKLYKSIIDHKNFDTSFIADSEGVFTKFKHYSTIMSSVDALNKLCGSTSSVEVVQINELIGILEAYRADFIFGYKMDIDYIQMTYELIILSLFQLIDFAICAYVETIKPNGLSNKSKRPRVKYTGVIGALIRTFKKGEWTKLVASTKKDVSKGVQESLLGNNDENTIAQEDITAGAVAVAVKNIPTMGAGIVAGAKAVGAAWKAGGVIKAVGALATGFGGSALGIAGAAAIVSVVVFAAAVILLNVLSIITCWWYGTRFKLSDYLNRQAELLKYNTAANDDKYDKKQAQIAKLQAIADFIAVKTSVIADSADKEEAKDKKDNFSTYEIKTAVQDVNDGVEF